MNFTLEEYQSRNGLGKESWAEQAAQTIALMKEKDERIKELENAMRRWEAQLALGREGGIRTEISHLLGHYMSCSWWGTERVCDCGGRQ